MSPIRVVVPTLAALLLPAAAAHAVPTVQTHTTITAPVALSAPVPVGDVNGDGLEDLAITGDSCEGAAAIVFGSANPATISLSSLGTRGITLTSSDPCSLRNAAPAGDVNGDGRADVVFRSTSSGPIRARVVYGRPTGGTLDVGALGSNGWTIERSSTRRVYGVRGVGDITGDGRGDLAIDYGVDGEYPDSAGESIVVFGATGGRTIDPETTGVPALRFKDSLVSRDLSIATLPLGDASGDGKVDLLTYTGSYSPAAVHVGRSAPGVVDLAALGDGSLSLGTLPVRFGWTSPSYGDVDGDRLLDYVGEADGPVIPLSSKLRAPVPSTWVTSDALDFRAVPVLPSLNVKIVGDLSGDRRDEVSVQSESPPLFGGDWWLPVDAQNPGAWARTWSFLVAGSSSPRSIDVASPTGGAVRLDSEPPGYTIAGGAAFAGRPSQLVSSSADRKTVLVQRVVDAPTPVDTTRPTITNLAIENPTIWRTVPCGSEGGPACPGPRSTTVRFSVSESVSLRLRFVDGAGRDKLQVDAWMDAGAKGYAVRAAHRYQPAGFPFPVTTQLPAGQYRWVLDAQDLAGNKATTVTSAPITVTG